MNFYEIIKAIYKKEVLVIDKIDVTLCIILTNILKLDRNNLPNLKKIIQYLFFIEPKRYIMLLFVGIPKNSYPPFLKKVEKQKPEKNDLLLMKIQYILNWSTRELNRNKLLLDKVIDRNLWKNELGVKA